MKKTLILACTAALSSLILAGCGEEAKTSAPAQTPAAQTQAPAAETAPAPTPAPAPAANAAPTADAASADRPGRGCLKIVADHPYDFKDMRFDEAAQALAHASGCFVRYTDQEIASWKIAPVAGTMSIKDAIAKSLEGSPYGVLKATDEEIEVGKR